VVVHRQVQLPTVPHFATVSVRTLASIGATILSTSDVIRSGQVDAELLSLNSTLVGQSSGTSRVTPFYVATAAKPSPFTADMIDFS